MKASKQDREMFVAVFMESAIASNRLAVPTLPLNLHNVVYCARRVMSLGSSMGTLAVRLCNGDIDQEYYDKRKESIRKRITEAATVAGATEIILGGDPRGHTVKLVFPTGRANTWGGVADGYAVPTS